MLSKALDAYYTKGLVSVNFFFLLLFLKKKIAKETEWDNMVGRKTIGQEWGAKDSKDCGLEQVTFLCLILQTSPLNCEKSKWGLK